MKANSHEFGTGGNEGKQIQKIEYLENKKSFLDEIKSIFHGLLRVINWQKK